MKYYTYAHQTADTGKIFYIGKGASQYRYKQKSNRNQYWNRIVNKHGFEAVILACWATNEEACEHEKLLISSFRDMGYQLANLTDGGEGTIGFKFSPESIAKRIAHYKGKPSHRKGLPLPESHYKNLINAKKNNQNYIKFSKAKSKRIICVDTGQMFESGAEASRWLQSIGKMKKAFQGNISRSAKTGIKAYGYHWKLA